MVPVGIFLITLTASSATIGLFIYRALAEHGFAAGYDASLYLTLASASGFAFVQVLYVALVAFVKPVRGGVFWLFEAASHAVAVVFIPSLRGISIPLPHPALEPVEPLVYLGVFGVCHALLKLVSFFAALQSEPGSRVWGVAWVATLLVLAGVGNHALNNWLALLEQNRPQVTEREKFYRVDDQYARARSVPEDASVSFETKPCDGRAITIRWAVPPELTTDRPRYIHVYATLRGKTTRSVYTPLRLQNRGWTEFHLSADDIGKEVSACTVRWRSEKEPFWMTKLGLYPGRGGDGRMLMSGPWLHVASSDTSPPSLIIIGVDGLGTASLSRHGNNDILTRSLDQFSQTAIAFTNAFAPAPEAAASYMTLFTGVSPLEHGFLGAHRGPLPEGFLTLFQVFQKQEYTTAAFTEAEVRGDLIFGTGWERGIEIFDVSYEKQESSPDGTGQEPEAEGNEASSPLRVGSVATLDKARDWIEQNKTNKFAIFIRLGELVEQAQGLRYTSSRTNATAAATRRTVVNETLMHLDRYLGAFFKDVQNSEGLKNTMIVITAPFAISIAGSDSIEAVSMLSDQTLRVPVMLRGPQFTPAVREDIISTGDVPNALASIVAESLNPSKNTGNFLKGPINTLAVSMTDTPLTLSVRGPKWRMVWKTGKTAFSATTAGTPEPPRLFDAARAARSGYVYDESARNLETVTRYRTILEELIEVHETLWKRASQNSRTTSVRN